MDFGEARKYDSGSEDETDIRFIPIREYPFHPEIRCHITGLPKSVIIRISINLWFRRLNNMQKKFRKIAVCCFSVLCFLWISDAYGQAKERRLTISNISLDKKTFFPDKDAGVKISYKLSGDAFVAIRFYNDRDIRVRTLTQNEITASGSHSAEWDGKNDSGEPLPSGVYIYTIEAKRDNGERVMYDPADETGGILLKVRKPFLDTESGEISYVMPKAGMVRMRAGIKEGPLLKTIIDWEPKEAGKNVEKWDGKDKSGLIDLFRIPKREAHIFAYSLPDNCIILSDSSPSFVKGDQGRFEYRPRKKTDAKLKYEHALHKKIGLP